MSTHQTENGYTRIADSLLDALILADLSKREYKILLAVIRRTYGFGKTEALLSASFLAKATGLQENHISSVVPAMVRRTILTSRRTYQGNLLGVNKAFFPNLPTPKTGVLQIVNDTPRTGGSDTPKTGGKVIPPKQGVASPPKQGGTTPPKQGDKRNTSIDTSKDIPPISPPFAEFWDQYPRKVAKAKAATCWKNLTKTDRTAALAALPGWPFPPESRFQPYATTWLNQRRWEDEPDTAPTTTRSNGNGNYRQQQHEFLERQAALAGLGLGATATDDGLVVDMDGGLVRRRLLGQDGA